MLFLKEMGDQINTKVLRGYNVSRGNMEEGKTKKKIKGWIERCFKLSGPVLTEGWETVN